MNCGEVTKLRHAPRHRAPSKAFFMLKQTGCRIQICVCQGDSLGKCQHKIRGFFHFGNTQLRSYISPKTLGFYWSPTNTSIAFNCHLRLSKVTCTYSVYPGFGGYVSPGHKQPQNSGSHNSHLESLSRWPVNVSNTVRY